MARGGSSLTRTIFFDAFGTQRLNFQRAAEQLEIADGRAPAQHLFQLGDLDIAHPTALDAYHVMMRCQVAVVARAVMERGDLARLANLAQRLERAMHRGERYMRMLAAHDFAYRIGARMLSRRQQRLDDREPLRRHREAALAASLGKLREPPGGVPGAAPLIDQL